MRREVEQSPNVVLSYSEFQFFQALRREVGDSSVETCRGAVTTQSRDLPFVEGLATSES